MKSMTAKIGALVALTSTYSFALFGIGGHWAPNFGTKVQSADEIVFNRVFTNPNTGDTLDVLSARLDRGESKPLNGFGIKVWIDALPIVDIEATVNFQGATYPAALNYDLIGDETGTQKIELRVPGSELLPIEKVDPAFGWVMADLSVTYPIDIPIPVLDWSFYAGGGISYIYGTPIVSKSFAEKVVNQVMESAVAQLENAEEAETPTPEEIAKELYDAFKDEGIHQGVGAHVIFGTRIDIILISLYANGKYHFGGLPEEINSGLTVEIGAGFGI